MQVKKHQLELDMEQRTGSKLGKEYVKAEYCHLTYSMSMQSTSYKTLGWVDHNKPWKILKEMGILYHLTCSWETCMQVKKQLLEPCMKQLIGSG